MFKNWITPWHRGVCRNRHSRAMPSPSISGDQGARRVGASWEAALSAGGDTERGVIHGWGEIVNHQGKIRHENTRGNWGRCSGAARAAGSKACRTEGGKGWALPGSWNKPIDLLRRGCSRTQLTPHCMRYFKPCGTEVLCGGLLGQSIGTWSLILKNCAILYNTEILKYLKAFSIGCSSDWLWCIFQQFFLKMLIRGSRNEVFCVLCIDSHYFILIPKYRIPRTAKKTKQEMFVFCCCMLHMLYGNQEHKRNRWCCIP